MKEFFGFGGFNRPVEGFLSWQHLTFVGCMLLIMAVLAYVFGRKNKNADDKTKNKVLIWSAILIDAFEIAKIIILSFRADDPMVWKYNLPLFMCSLQLITIPLAAFSKGRLREASLDFVMIFGILGAMLGTIGAGNIYSCFPVFSFDTVVSAITHCISGFASLYIMFANMTSMKKSNEIITFSILTTACVAAYIVNVIIDYNYMFLMRGDGTPYDILYALVNGSRIFYPLLVVALFFLYIGAFYLIYFRANKKAEEKNTPKASQEFATIKK
jgi:uncharacterized membrane protein YwaF